MTEDWPAPTANDGPWRWNGFAWVSASPLPARPRLRDRIRDLGWPRWLLTCSAVWTAALVAWLPAAGATARHHSENEPLVRALVICGAVATICTLLLGGVLGWTRRWRHGVALTVAGTAVLLVSYGLAMVAFADSNDTTADNAAGAGVVILTVPTMAIVAALLAVGFGVGYLLNRTFASRS